MVTWTSPGRGQAPRDGGRSVWMYTLLNHLVPEPDEHKAASPTSQAKPHRLDDQFVGQEQKSFAADPRV